MYSPESVTWRARLWTKKEDAKVEIIEQTTIFSIVI